MAPWQGHGRSALFGAWPEYLELEALRLRVWSHGGVRLVLTVAMATAMVAGAVGAAPVPTLVMSAASLLGSRPATWRQP